MAAYPELLQEVIGAKITDIREGPWGELILCARKGGKEYRIWIWKDDEYLKIEIEPLLATKMAEVKSLEL